MTGRWNPSDDELIAALGEAFDTWDPIPQHVFDEGRARLMHRCAMVPPYEPGTRPAHEFRRAGFPVPGLPGQTPGGVAVPDDNAALPGHQTTLAGGEAGARGVQRRDRGQVAGLETPHEVTARPGPVRDLPSRAVRIGRRIRRLIGR